MYSIHKKTIQSKNIDLIKVDLQDLKISFLNYGATIYDLQTKDKNNQFETIIFQYDDIEEYIENSIYINTTIGPYSGRLQNGQYHINNQTYQLDLNDQSNNLHSGTYGLHKKIFDYKIKNSDTSFIIEFSYKDTPNEAFQGTQEYLITYTITNSTLQIDFNATTNEDTLMNLTNHTYFNLSGNLKRDIKDHHIFLDAKQILQTNQENLPIGMMSIPKHLILNKEKIQDIFQRFPNQNQIGIDHQYLLSNPSLQTPQASLFDNISKRKIEVYTNYPVIVCYTHNHPSKALLQNKVPQTKHQGVCFETQYESNGIHILGCNDSILKANNIYHKTTIYKFFIEEE